MKEYINKIYNKKFICLILMLILITNSYFIAKYYSTVSNSDGKTIAKFNVSMDTSDNVSDNLSIISDKTTASYVIKVINTSEVSTRYSIVLSNVPNGLEVSLDNGIYKASTNNIITFDNVGSFSTGDTNDTHTHTLTFNDPSSTNNDGVYSIDINVNVEQVD